MRYQRYPAICHDVAGSQGMPFPAFYKITWFGPWSGPLASLNAPTWLQPASLGLDGIVGMHITSWEGSGGVYQVFSGGGLHIIAQKYYRPALHWWLFRFRIETTGFTGHRCGGEIVIHDTFEGDHHVEIGWSFWTGFDRDWMADGVRLNYVSWVENPPDP